MISIKEAAISAKEKSYALSSIPIEIRNRVLLQISNKLRNDTPLILSENKKDLDYAIENRLGQALIKRLTLSKDKIEEMAVGLEGLIQLSDPLGKLDMKRELDKGLILYRESVPIGLIGVIFESRPDAFIQIASLCIKSGNSAILKGGSEAINSNKILFELIEAVLNKVDTRFEGSIVLAQTRDDIKELLALDDVIDLMIPRGSNALVKYIKENTRIPVLGHADGICHIYVDKTADIDMAVSLIEDSKCQYPAVCNAVETVLLNSEIAQEIAPLLAKKMASVELRGDLKVCSIIDIKAATKKDWETEYNDLILSIKIVENVEQAITHINKYGSHHTDCIISNDNNSVDTFFKLVDSSTVMHNSSTRFADGFRYGFGAEVGISTNKIHARGPVGLEGLTIYRYRLVGNGHCVRAYADGKLNFTHKDIFK